MGIFNRGSSIDISDFEIIKEQHNKVALKSIAFETCIGLIANAVTQIPFIVKERGTIKKNQMHYRLNVRPNKNQNNVEFWTTVIRRMILDGECLVIYEGDEMLIADNFNINKNAMKFDYKFQNVSINSFTFPKTFYASDVLYFSLSNENLNALVKELDNDYVELFSSIIETQKKSRQIRATYSMKSINSKDPNNVAKLQSFISKLTESFRKNSYAVVPLQVGDEYKEHTSTSVGDKGVDELGKLTNIYLKNVAMALHIPPQIFNGDLADISEHNSNFVKYCIKPILNLITSEISGKIFSRQEVQLGTVVTYNTTPLTLNNVFEVAERMDKFIQDGVFSINDVLEELGRDRVNDPELDKRYVTKNVQVLGEKGGENDGE